MVYSAKSKKRRRKRRSVLVLSRRFSGRLGRPNALMAEAGLCIAAALVLTIVIYSMYNAFSGKLNIKIKDVSEMKVSYNTVSDLKVLSERFNIAFDELFTIYMAENKFFPKKAERQNEISLERQYIINYGVFQKKYASKNIKPYRDLIRQVLAEIECFPVSWEYMYIAPETDAAPSDLHGYMYGDGFTLAGGGLRHTGIDIYDRENIPGRLEVVSVCEGIVEEAGENKTNGKYIVVSSGLGNKYYYYNLYSIANDLAAGSRVYAGQTLGRMGNTGSRCSAGGLRTRLHFALLTDTDDLSRIWVNPYIFLRLIEDAL